MLKIKKYSSNKINKIKYYSINIIIIFLIAITFIYGNIIGAISLSVFYIAFLLSVVL